LRSLFFFIFDLSLPIQRAQTLLLAFAESLSDTDVAVVASISGSSLTLLYVEDQIPFFAAASHDFSPTDLYEMNKAELSAMLLPALPALYNVQPPTPNTQTVDVLGPLQVCVRQAERRPFAIFFFLTSPVSPITAERAAAASRTIASSGGVVHFGATEHFKRLSAIAQSNFGFVFGISECLPTLLKKLIDGSQPLAIKLYCPRFVELEKVTGSDGSVRSSTSLRVVKLKSVRGCSGRLSIDFQRIFDQPKTVRIAEVIRNVNGRFVRIHSFPFAEAPGAFRPDFAVTQNLVLKGCASDILRTAWAGGDWQKTVAKVLGQPPIAPFLAKTCLADLENRPDRDALKFFYVLECFFADLANRMVAVGGASVFVAPPIVCVYSEGDPVAAAEQAVASEYPFEVRILSDKTAFRLLVEKLGGTLG
jgi:hypothetical protein